MALSISGLTAEQAAAVMRAPTFHRREPVDLARWLASPAFPFRYFLANHLLARSRLSVDGDILARALQWQTGSPALLDASGGLDVVMAQMMGTA
jgi:hypothetical protein